MPIPPDVAILLAQLDWAFDRKSWHGTNLRGSLRGISAAQAAWRPGTGRHNIWELAVHAAYWKYAVNRMLTGEKRGAFPLAGSNFFPRPQGAGGAAVAAADWKQDLALLAATHRALRASVAALSSRDLHQVPAGGKTTVLAMVSGIVAHDLYHAGQIQLLKRLMPGSL